MYWLRKNPHWMMEAQVQYPPKISIGEGISNKNPFFCNRILTILVDTGYFQKLIPELTRRKLLRTGLLDKGNMTKQAILIRKNEIFLIYVDLRFSFGLDMYMVDLITIVTLLLKCLFSFNEIKDTYFYNFISLLGNIQVVRILIA